MTARLRQSVPTADLEQYWSVGWSYVVPDFDKPDHSIIEWLSDKMPVYPNCVPETSTTENAEHERTASGA